MVGISTLETYLELLTEFMLRTGIARQVEAFRAGFSTVFPLEKLSVFTPDEVREGSNRWGVEWMRTGDSGQGATEIPDVVLNRCL